MSSSRLCALTAASLACISTHLPPRSAGGHGLFSGSGVRVSDPLPPAGEIGLERCAQVLLSHVTSSAIAIYLRA
jgi:hypothetical protein